MLEVKVAIEDFDEDGSDLDLTIEVKPTTMPSMDQKSGKQFSFYFEKDPNYRVLAANSVMTTVSEFGDIRIDFFVQGIGMPQETHCTIQPDGSLKEVDSSDKIVRRAQVGILLSIDNAIEICKFVLDEAQKAKDRQKK